MKGDLKTKEILKVILDQGLEIDLKVEGKENIEIKQLFHI
jgi:hypothetical protein